MSVKNRNRKMRSFANALVGPSTSAHPLFSTCEGIYFAERRLVTEIPSTVTKHADQPGSDTKNSEHWIIFPFNNQLFVHAHRNQKAGGKKSSSEKNGWCLQSAAILTLGRLPNVNDVGFVYVYVPADADGTNIAHLLQRLVKVGEQKSFSVFSINVPHSLDECLSTFGLERMASNTFTTAQFKPLLVH